MRYIVVKDQSYGGYAVLDTATDSYVVRGESLSSAEYDAGIKNEEKEGN